MSLRNFRTLGHSGLFVIPLCLGTMTFGPGRWGADEATSRAVFDAYPEAGGNFVDTADMYSGGASEELLGKFLKDSASRDTIVLATRFGFNASASPLQTTRALAGNPNAVVTELKTSIVRSMHRLSAWRPTMSTCTGCTSAKFFEYAEVHPQERLIKNP